MQLWLTKKFFRSVNGFLIVLLLIIGVWVFYSPVSKGQDQALVPKEKDIQRSVPKYQSHKLASLFKSDQNSLVQYPSVRLVGRGARGEDQYGIVEHKGRQFLVKEGEQFQGHLVEKINEKGVVFGQAKHLKPTQIERREIVQAVSHWDQILRQVRILPYTYDQNAYGYILLNVRPHGIVEQVGLRSGDIIKSVNGYKMRGLNDLVALYEELNHTSRLSFDIRRGTKDIFIDYEITDEVHV